MTAWLGVVSRDHVRRGVQLGIAQIGHGKRSGLAKMQRGDWLVYYSPRASLSGNEPVKAFTALGEIVDDEVWQADEGDFLPWRRAVAYQKSAVDVPVADVAAALELTSSPSWGYRLRRGIVALTDADFETIRRAMTLRP
ncbi:MAG: EVE domain-containing protein [Nocardioidaceae bacterium]|nr:EVE domain-containing protein [Nocardioidaceae bacterium]